MYNEVDLLRLDRIVECSFCRSSKVERQGLITTIATIHEFDAPDGHHEHDGNHIEVSYVCGNGHKFTIQPINSCWCGWKQSIIPSKCKLK